MVTPTGMPTETDEDVTAAGRKLIAECGIEAVLATRSECGPDLCCMCLACGRQGAFAVGVLHRDLDLALLDLRAKNPGVQVDVQALLLEDAMGLLGDIGVGQREEVGQGFQQSDLGTQAVPDRAQFQSDHAGADHTQRFRHGLEVQCADVVDNVLAVDLDVGDFDRHGTGRQNHVVGAELDRVAAVDGGNRHGAVGAERTLAVEEGDLVGLEQLGDAAGELFHHAVLAFDHGRHVDRCALDGDAVLGELVLDVVVVLARIQQRLGRDAAHVQAGAAGGGLAVLAEGGVHAGRFQAELRGADGRDVAAGAAADDDDVEFFTHVHSSKTQEGRKPRPGCGIAGRGLRPSYM